MTKNIAVIGFEILPSQSLSQVNTNGLQNDLISLLFSLTYNPENISKVTLDLRYIAGQDQSLVAKGLDIVLLIRLDFNETLSSTQSTELLESFRSNFQDLLSLHLLQYEFGIVPIPPQKVKAFLHPFEVVSVVEITRRITNTRPFALTTFNGGSPMTRVVDMMLREEGQCFLSISLEPHLLTEEQTRQFEVFGYQNPVIPSHKDEDELLEAVLNLQQITRSMQSIFRMKIRIAADKPISQYLINLIGSEISGQRDFYYFRPPDNDSLGAEINSLKTLEFISNLKEVIKLDVPPILLDLVYLFRPEEAVTAFRLPTQRISVAQEKAYKTYPAPVRFLPSRGLQLGTTTHPSYKGELPVYISLEDRARHVYVIGKTGTGKSGLILNMIQQDVQDKGICVIDPHGDLVNAIFPYIPEDRINDVYYFDPADPDYVPGFNFLETSPNSDEAERDYIVQEVLSMLLRFVDYDIQMFGPIAQQWTRFGCMTLMDSRMGTLTDVPRLFSDDRFRAKVLEQVRNPILKQWWQYEYQQMTEYRKSEIMGYFTSKFTPMVTAPQIRNIVGQERSTIDFNTIMNEGKILLVNLSSGMIGKVNSHFLGSMLVSRLLWTALSRAKDPVATRRQHFLFVDEFQNFITDSFEQILSEARKYGLSLTIAHQHLDQLRSMGRMSNKIERAVFGNVGTMISFRLGGDASFLAGEFGNPVDAITLKNLANRYAVATMQVEGIPSMPFTMRTVDWILPTDAMIRRGEVIKERARRRGRKIQEVVAEIESRFDNSSSNVTSITWR